MTTTIRVTGGKSMKRVIKDVNRVNKKIVPAARVSALNKVAAKIRTASYRDAAKSIGIPQRVLRGSRVKRIPARVILRRANRRREAALLTALTLPVAAAKAGNAKQGRKGARVGRHHQFGGSFVATMPSGHRGIFRRKPGVGRLPINEVTIPLSPMLERAIEKNLKAMGQREWPRIFERELAFRLRRGR